MLYLYIYLRDGWPSADVYKTCRRGCIDTRETKEEKNIYFSCNTGKKKIKYRKKRPCHISIDDCGWLYCVSFFLSFLDTKKKNTPISSGAIFMKNKNKKKNSEWTDLHSWLYRSIVYKPLILCFQSKFKDMTISTR